MNLNEVMYKKIISSDYFRRKIKHVNTFEEAVDEIYNSVGHMMPTINKLGEPSSGFCLIFRLFCFRLNERQMLTMLNHRDSPYVDRNKQPPLATEKMLENTDGVLRPPSPPISVLSGGATATFYLC